MLCRPGLSPNEHPLKQLDKNQCSNKRKLIIPSSALAEIITLDRRRRSFPGRVRRPPAHAKQVGLLAGRFRPGRSACAGSPERRAPGTTRPSAGHRGPRTRTPRGSASRGSAQQALCVDAATETRRGTAPCRSPKPLLVNRHRSGPPLDYVAKTQARYRRALCTCAFCEKFPSHVLRRRASGFCPNTTNLLFLRSLF